MANLTQRSSTGRIIVTQVPVGIVSLHFGPVRTYAGKVTGGSGVTAVLGPDLGDGQRRGTPTNSSSLQPVMSMLNTSTSPHSWVAGHLLNADLGGIGTDDRNLTALTSAANANHKTFESHVKRLLARCRALDLQQPDATSWYGLRYTVGVSTMCFAHTPHPSDVHSYAYSHVTFDYGVVRIDKTSRAIAFANDQTAMADFAQVVLPTYTIGTTQTHMFNGPLQFGPVEAHNG